MLSGNSWFDEECKKARRMWKESDKDNIIKVYKQILRKKKIDFMVSRREELIFHGKIIPNYFGMSSNRER